MQSSIDYAFGDYAKAMKPHENIVYHTPAGLIHKGMCICSDCGTLSSIDYKICKKCNSEILIIKEKNEKN